MDFMTFRPLAVWPHATTTDRKSRWSFKAPWSDTIDKLEYEIGRIGGHDVIVATLHRDGDIRQDGLPRSGARDPHHPGVEISFTADAGAGPAAARGRQLLRQHGGRNEALRATHPDTSGYDSGSDFAAVMTALNPGRMVFATDAFERWEHNVRAIALTLEALRAVDRYAATQGRQYAGFAALNPGSTVTTRTV